MIDLRFGQTPQAETLPRRLLRQRLLSSHQPGLSRQQNHHSHLCSPAQHRAMARTKQTARKSTRRAPRKTLGQRETHSSGSDTPSSRRDRQSSSPPSPQQPSKTALTDLPKEALSRIFEDVRQRHLGDYYYAMDRETGRFAKGDAAMIYHRRLVRLTFPRRLLTFQFAWLTQLKSPGLRCLHTSVAI